MSKISKNNKINMIGQKIGSCFIRHFETKNNRDIIIDSIRTLAIFLMTFVHTRIYTYTYVNSNSIIDKISDFGGNVSYILFLFCFGFGIYVLLNGPKKANNRSIISRKILQLFAIYILVSLVGYISLIFKEINSTQTTLKEVTANPNFWKWISDDVLLIISGKELVYLTEFFISFPLFLSFVLIFRKIVNLIIRSDLYLYIFSFTIYLIGYLFYEALQTKTAGAFLWGYQDLHYFPIFFYLVVFLLGARWAHINKFAKDEFKLKWLLYTFLSFTLVGFITGKIFDFERFPPSIPFLTYGISITLSIPLLVLLSHAIYKFFRKNGMQTLRNSKIFTALKTLKKTEVYIGQRSLRTFSLHTIMMFLYLIFNQPIQTNWYQFIIVWLITLFAAILI